MNEKIRWRALELWLYYMDHWFDNAPKKPFETYLTDLEGSICDDLTGGNKSMYVPCLHCGKPTPEDLVAITPFGLQPVCSDNCLRFINNADHDIDTFNAIKEKLECQTQKTQQKK